MKRQFFRAISLLMAIVMICSLVVLPASAEEAEVTSKVVGSWSQDNKTYTGEWVLEGSNDLALSSLSLYLGYEKTVFASATITPVTVSGATFSSSHIDQEGILSIGMITSSAVSPFSGGQFKIADISFTLKDDVEKGGRTILKLRTPADDLDAEQSIKVNKDGTDTAITPKELPEDNAYFTIEGGATPAITTVTFDNNSDTTKTISVNGTTGGTAQMKAASAKGTDITKSVTWSVATKPEGATNDVAISNGETDAGKITVSPTAKAGSYTIRAEGKGDSSTGNAEVILTVTRTRTATSIKFYDGDTTINSNSVTIGIPSQGSGNVAKTYTAKVFDQFEEVMDGQTTEISAGTATAIGDAGGKALAISATNGAVAVTAGGADSQVVLTAKINGQNTPSQTLTVQARSVSIPWPKLNAADTSGNVITYGGTKQSAFSNWKDSGKATAYVDGGEEQYDGDFSIEDASDVLDAGSGTIKVIFTPRQNQTPAGYESASSMEYTVTVGKKPITVKMDNKSKTYGEENPEFTYALKSGSTLVGTDKLEDITTITPACTADASTPVGSVDITGAAGTSDNYTVTVEKGILTINKATITVPAENLTCADLTITANAAENAGWNTLLDKIKDTYKSISGTYGTKDTTIALTPSWTVASGNPTFDEKGGQTYTFSATLAPSTGEDNFNTVTAKVTAKIIVSKVTAALTLASTTKDVKANDIKDITDLATLALPTTATAKYTPNDVADGTFSITGWKSGNADVNADTIKTAANKALSDNANQVLKLTPVFTVGKNTGDVPAWVTMPDTLPEFTLTITPKAPVTVTVTGSDKITYGTAITTTGDTPTFRAAQTEIAAGDGTDTNGTYTFTYKGRGDTTYTESETAPTNAGTYTLTATLVSNSHSGSGTFNFEIEPKTIAGVTVALVDSTTPIVYDGTAKTPAVTVKDGEKVLTKDTDYTLEYSSNTNAGSAVVTVKGKGNYDSATSKVFNFTIEKFELNKDNVSISGTADSYPFSKKEIKPKVNVTVTGVTGTLTAGTDYELEYTTDCTNVGVKTITVKAKGSNFKDPSDLANAAKTTYEITKATLTGAVTITVAQGDGQDTAGKAKINEGDKLTADVSKLSDSTEGNLSFQWYRGETAIDGETAKVYTVKEAGTDEPGDKISVKVTAGAGSNYEGTVASDPVTIDAIPMPSATVSFTAAVTAGANSFTLTATVKFTPEGYLTADVFKANFFVQWYRDGVAITPAISMSTANAASLLSGEETVELAGQTYVTTEADRGHVITAAVVPKTGSDYSGKLAASSDTITDGSLTTGNQDKGSLANGAFTYSATKPSDPTVTVTTTTNSATVSWTPGNANGSTVTNWVVTCNGESKTLEPGATSVTFTGLNPDTQYTFTVKAESTEGDTGTVSVSKKTAAVPTGPDTPVTPTPTPGGNSGSSSGGGSSSGSSGKTTVATTGSVKNGSIHFSATDAKEGDTVTITARPKSGYEVDEIIVRDKNGDIVRVREGSRENTFTFVMPAGKVTVEAVFVKSGTASQPSTNPFYDVSESAYYYDAVLWALENDITGGTSATTFAPGAACTRAQTVTFLWRAAGCPAPQSTVNPFTDLNPGSYYYDAVLWAVEQGITNGLSADAFAPNATVNRAQVVTFLYRSAKASAEAAGGAFNDVAADAYYAGPVQWAVANGITNGTTATTFGPANPCTRGQIVTFLYRHFV